MDNSSASSHVAESLDLYAQGQVCEALWGFFEAAGNDPTDPLNHYLSGLALRALGLEAEAQSEWQEALALTLQQEPSAQQSEAEDALSLHSQWAGHMARRLLQQAHAR